MRGLIFPNEEEFSSAPVHGAVGSEGYSSLLGTALHSAIAGPFCFLEIPLHKVGPGDGVFMKAPPPLGHPESGRAFGW